MKPLLAVLVAGAAVALAGCASEAPLTPYDLGPAVDVSIKRRFPLDVEVASAAPHLDSARILVLDFGEPLVLAGASWSRPLPALVADRLRQSLNAPQGAPRRRLTLAIRRFQLDAEARRVTIDLHATVEDAASGARLRQRDFTAGAAVRTTLPSDVAAGFERAFTGLEARIAAFAFDP